MRFAIKHAVATAVVTLLFVAIVAASYCALLAWAAAVGQGIGGPLAFPFMVLLALYAAVVCIVGALFPVTTLAELIASRVLHWHRLSQIPLSGGLLLVYLVGLAIAVGLVRGTAIDDAASAGLLLAIALLIPLGAYWWCLQSTDLVLGVVDRLLQLLFRSPGSHGANV